MKRLVLTLASLAFATTACAASLPVTQANIDKASNGPSDAKSFTRLGDRPTGEQADKPGDTVIFTKDGVSYQYGSSQTPAQMYDAQTGGGGGE